VDEAPRLVEAEIMPWRSGFGFIDSGSRWVSFRSHGFGIMRSTIGWRGDGAPTKRMPFPKERLSGNPGRLSTKIPVLPAWSPRIP
jgi:hypothetical protein